MPLIISASFLICPISGKLIKNPVFSLDRARGGLADKSACKENKIDSLPYPLGKKLLQEFHRQHREIDEDNSDEIPHLNICVTRLDGFITNAEGNLLKSPYVGGGGVVREALSTDLNLCRIDHRLRKVLDDLVVQFYAALSEGNEETLGLCEKDLLSMLKADTHLQTALENQDEIATRRLIRYGFKLKNTRGLATCILGNALDEKDPDYHPPERSTPRMAFIKFLVEEMHADVNQPEGENKKTPLMYLAECNLDEMKKLSPGDITTRVQYLLTKKADVHAQDKHDRTALTYALLCDKPEIAQLIIDHDRATLTQRYPLSHNRNALMIVCTSLAACEKTTFLSDFLDKAIAADTFIDAIDNHGNTALLLLVKSFLEKDNERMTGSPSSFLQPLSIFIRKGVNLLHKNTEGNTLFHYLAYGNYHDEMLLCTHYLLCIQSTNHPTKTLTINDAGSLYFHLFYTNTNNAGMTPFLINLNKAMATLACGSVMLPQAFRPSAFSTLSFVPTTFPSQNHASLFGAANANHRKRTREDVSILAVAQPQPTETTTLPAPPQSSSSSGLAPGK